MKGRELYLKKCIDEFRDTSEKLIIALERIYSMNRLVAIKEYEDFVIKYNRRARDLLNALRVEDFPDLPHFDVDDDKMMKV